MKIETLKDLKIALKDIPDDVLSDFGAGVNSFEASDFVTLLCWGEEIEAMENYVKQSKKYPQLNEISKWITNIAKEQEKKDDEGNWLEKVNERDAPISSKDKL